MECIEKILDKYEQSPLLSKLSNGFAQNNFSAHILGSCGSSISFILSALYKKSNKALIYILPDKNEAAYIQNDLQCIFPDIPVLFFSDSLRANISHKDPTNIIMRTEVIDTLVHKFKRPPIIVTYADALLEKVMHPNYFRRFSYRIKQGESINLDAFNEKMISWHFERVDFVFEAGQFSIRGGIVDIFSFGEENPYRIELFDDEVESIRLFDLDSQRSIKEVRFAKIIPDTGMNFPEKEHCNMLSLLDNDTFICIIKDAPLTKYRLEDIEKKIVDRLINVKDEKDIVLYEQEGHSNKDIGSLFDTPANVIKLIESFSLIEYGSKQLFKADETFELKTLPQPSFNKNFELMVQSFRQLKQRGVERYIFSANSKQIERFYEIFEDINANVDFSPVYRTIHSGFIDEEAKIACFTDHEVFNRFNKYKLRKKPAKSRNHIIKFLQELSSGDFIVHVDHGVGQYAGIQKINKNGLLQEVIKIIYKDGDVLYVNIHSLHKVYKYSGKEGTIPKINKLGSGSWEKLKKRTKKKVKDIARDLIKLYADRRSKKGFSFTPDTYLQTELEASFIYEDTPDQLKATQDLKVDMEATFPMDRLICGDVGFGKTEIAMRAAFKAVADNKQVAVLVPTTILAFQHYNSFSKRFEDFPCNIDYLNRYKGAKETREVGERLESGKTDIIIGTHKLLSKNIKFKDLGLFIIDEEQKFGVSHKERLRNLKTNVDTLTLTATPIPRTLQFSLMGARDLSIINTPPPNRQPIETNVSVFHEELIGDAINYELSRGGQVFFVHNRIKDLEALKDVILGVSPHARINIAHGQLNGSDLESRILSFIEGKFDILLCTSLVESGIDMPNVNTIIINNAHWFGLSDLHQLRGRVGRSNKKAFCYLFCPPYYTLTPEARKRLKTIEEFSDLGGGFNIAMRDMDIRGAGNLLGAEQSGFIAEIGLEMFHRILDEAVQEIKEKEFGSMFKEESIKNKKFVRDVMIETDFEVMIPDKYINNINERLSIYTRIDKSKNIENLNDIKKELEDRFGSIPDSVNELFSAIYLRWRCTNLGIEKLSLKKGIMRCVFIQDHESVFYTSPIFHKIIAEVQNHSHRCQLKQTPKHLMLIVKDVNNISGARAFLEGFCNNA